MAPYADQPQRMPLLRSARARLRSERGWTLIELLVTTSLLILVLGAVVTISTRGQQAAKADSTRSVQVGTAGVAISTMGRDLRQACALLPVTASLNSRYCDTWFDTSKSTGAAPWSGSISSSCPATSTVSNCIDFITRTRFSSGVQNYQRIKLDCTQIRNSPSATACVRYFSSPVTSVSSLSSAPTNSSTLVDGIINSASGSTCRVDRLGNPITTPGLSVFPIFTWLSRGGSAVASPAPAGAAAVQVTLCAARRETLNANLNVSNGLANAAVLQDAAQLPNLTRDDTAG